MPPASWAGPDGNLWFTDFSGNKIGTVTTAGVLCPSCLDAAAQSNLADLVVNCIEKNNGLIDCVGTTPLR